MEFSCIDYCWAGILCLFLSLLMKGKWDLRFKIWDDNASTRMCFQHSD